MAKYVKKAKTNIALRLAGILFCLTLASVYMVSGLFARYITKGQGSDSARVITFGEITLTETGDFYADNKMMIVPGKDIAKSATVSFAGSEAATYVFVEVSVSDHWTYSAIDVDSDDKEENVFTMAGGKISWTVDDEWTKLSDNVYYRELAPNETLTDANIIADDVITVSHKITRGEMLDIAKVGAEMQNIVVTFRASVVQSNGFASATAAWTSLSGKGDGV